MTFLVVVSDRDAGWEIDRFGPFVSRQEADEWARRLRRQYTGLEASRGNFRIVKNAADTFDVRVVDVDDDRPADAA